MAAMERSDHEGSRTWQVSPDLMCFFHEDGRFASVNPAWEATLGWAQEELVGKPYADLLHPDDVERSNAGFGELLDGRPVLNFENRYRHKNGNYHWLSWVAVPEEDLFFCSARDITADHDRVDQIASQKAEADLREQFLAILGHDLRNPLAALDSGVNILERRVPDEAIKPILEQMQGSIKRMNELIRNVMDFARVRLGDGIGLELREHSDLGQQLARVVEEIQMVTPGVDFVVDDRLDRPVRCDAARMQQVLSNLVANAVTHGDWSEPIRIHFHTRPEEFVIEVANAGTAMTAAARENLFQPFFRGAPEESKQGLGLGLYIVSEIVSAHGGQMKVRSDDEKTCFAAVIPG